MSVRLWHEAAEVGEGRLRRLKRGRIEDGNCGWASNWARRISARGPMMEARLQPVALPWRKIFVFRAGHVLVQGEMMCGEDHPYQTRVCMVNCAKR